MDHFLSEAGEATSARSSPNPPPRVLVFSILSRLLRRIMTEASLMANNHQRTLEAKANKILAQAGFRHDGQRKSAKRESVRAISIPCGGKPGYRKR